MAQGNSGHRASGADKLMKKLHGVRNSRRAVERERTLLRRKLNECEGILRDLNAYEGSIQESLTALQEARQLVETEDYSSVDPHGSHVSPRPLQRNHHRMREGTIKADCYQVLEERGTFMTTQEIAEALAKRGRSFSYRNPSDLLGAVLRKSIQRGQGLFLKDGRKFGLLKQHEKASSHFLA